MLKMESILPVWNSLAVAVFILFFVYAETDVARDCMHGVKLPDGTCDCYSCWTGDTCSQYASRTPQFVRHVDTAILPTREDSNIGTFVYRAVAVDPDAEFCKDPDGCPCSSVTYFIAGQGDTSNFRVDKHTGDVTLHGDGYSLYDEYQVTIGASDDGLDYDTMTLVVHNGDNWDLATPNKYLADVTSSASNIDPLDYSSRHGDEVLSRHRRAVTIPGNVTFTLTKIGVNKDVVEIRAGVRIQFQLDIVFPQKSTDMQVELFSPDSDSIVMMLCNVAVKVGKNLAITGSTTPVMESLDNSKYNDRAVISLGTVTNSGADTSTLDPSTLTITYEAVMIENPSTKEGVDYWVSAGAEFNQENDVWVGQASFKAKIDNDAAGFSEAPTATVSGPSSLTIGDCANYNLDMIVNRPVVDLMLDSIVPVNAMSICQVKIVSVNDAYSCGFGKYPNYTSVYIPDGNTNGYNRVQMNLGRPINKMAREFSSATPPNANLKGLITFNMQVCMNDNPDLIPKPQRFTSSVNVGGTVIVVGTLDVSATAKVPKPVALNMNPSFKLSFLNGSDISRTRPLVIQLDMVVKENTSTEYLLEVMGPVKNGLAVLQVCTVKMVFAGENLACLDRRQFSADYIMSDNATNSLYPDVALVKLGTISNLGTVGWTQTLGDSRNTVSFQIIFKSTNHSDATIGSIQDIYFGMFVGADKLTVGRTNVTVVADSPASSMTTQNKPEITLTIGGDGNNKVPIGKAAQVLADIKTARGTTYSPFRIEFVMPNNSVTPLVNICKIKVVASGANNPCFVAKAVERAVQMLSDFNDGVVDRAVIEMDALCNIEQKTNDTEDHIVLAVNVVLMPPMKSSTNPTAVVSAGVVAGYNGASDLKEAHVNLEANLGAGPASVSVPPILKIVSNNGNLTAFPNGYPAKYLVRIKIAPNDYTPMLLNVSVTDNALSICAVRFVRIGDSYPCVKPTVGIITAEDTKLGINTASGIDLGLVTNVGTQPLKDDDNWDTNTLELEVVVKMSIDSALAPDGSTHTLKFILNYNQGSANQLTATTTVTTTSDKTSINAVSLALPSVSQMNVTSITGTDTPPPQEKLDTIVKSESKRVVISLDTVFNATSQLTVSVTTPLGTPDVLEILYIGFLDAGANLPCLKYGQTKATYEPRQLGGAFIDIASLDLGYVCNVGVVNDNTGAANRLRVESVIRLLSSAKIAVGSTLQIHGAINSNNSELLVFSVTLKVGDDSTYANIFENATEDLATISLNSTENPIVVGISHFKIFPIVFTIPPFSSRKIRVNTWMPTDVTAIMTVIGVKVVRSGSNLPKLERFQNDFVITKSSKYNTSQITTYTIQTGVISNSGVSYRNSQNTSDDDTFSVDFTLQMADSQVATDQSEHNVTFGLEVFGGNIVLLSVLVTAKRTQTETVIFNISSTVDLVNSTTNKVEIDTIFGLSSLSTAEGQDSVLNIFVPVFAAYVTTEVTSPFKLITNVEKLDTAIILSFGPIFFTDEIHLTTTLASNSSHPVPVGITGVDTVFCMQPIANTHTATDTAGDITYLNITVATTPQGSSGCAMGALGMESGAIQDCQLSSSADSLSGNEATEGRYNKGNGWSPFVHKGKVREERYFQVYFGQRVMVTKIQIQQQGPAWATELGLKYSNDGFSWITSDKKLSLTVGSSDQAKDVPSPQSSRYLRVLVYDLDQESQTANFRFEFMGCVTKAETTTDICSSVVKQPQRLPEFSRRTFIKAGSTLYVCDGIKGDDDIVQTCYSTNDDKSWTELDSRVGCILGYNSLDGRLFAVSATADTYMSSQDGSQWSSITLDDLTKTKALPTYKPAKIVPVDGDPALNAATPDSSFTDSGYGATIDGVMKSGAIIFSWSDCCP